MNRISVFLCLSVFFLALADNSALASGGGTPTVSPAVTAMIEAFDTNGNGRIDGTEFEKMPAAFRALDQNGDQVLSSDEWGSSGGTYDPTDLFLCIAFALVALLFSSLCSVAEAVLLSISPSYVANLEKEGKSSAKKVKNVKSNVDRSLAAILTLNTIAHTIGSGGAGAYAAKYWGDGAVGIAMIVLTLLILFVSEIIPQNHRRALLASTRADLGEFHPVPNSHFVSVYLCVGVDHKMAGRWSQSPRFQSRGIHSAGRHRCRRRALGRKGITDPAKSISLSRSTRGRHHDAQHRRVCSSRKYDRSRSVAEA